MAPRPVKDRVLFECIFRPSEGRMDLLLKVYGHFRPYLKSKFQRKNWIIKKLSKTKFQIMIKIQFHFLFLFIGYYGDQ